MVQTAHIRAMEILSRLGKNPVGAEIGVFRGSLSRRLLVRPDLRLFMVDSWGEYRDGYAESGDYVAGLSTADLRDARDAAESHTRFAEERRTICQGDSVRSADDFEAGRLDFVFIDADHTLDACRADINAWAPKLKPGGLLCGHDYDRPDLPNVKWGVKQAVDEFAEAYGLTVELGGDHTWFIRMPGPLPEPSEAYDHIVFACVKWGEKYDARYVNVLADMVARNCELPFRFLCYTDDGAGLLEEVEVHPLPRGYEGWWNKLWLFSRDATPPRSRIVFLDLDVIVTGALEPLVVQKGIAADWLQGGYNSSVMVWDHGEHAEAWDKIKPSDIARLHGDQDWLTELGGWDYLPADWIVSYREHAREWPPETAIIVAFHGWPKPGDFDARGYPGLHPYADPSPWVPEMWSMGGLAMPRFTSQLNTDITTVRANAALNVSAADPVAWPVDAHDRTAIIVAGGPSLGRWLQALQLERAKDTFQGSGCEVWAVNGVHDYLIDRGITPDAMVMLDSRKACPETFLSKPHPDVRYMIATQCDPESFDRLKGFNVQRWTGWAWGIEEYDDHIIGGGATVGLKSIALAYAMGFRKFKLFGYDASYENGADHAYPQPLNANDLRVDVVLRGRKFVAARWMAKQVVEFLGMANTLTADPAVTIDLFCDGLLPYAANIAGEKRKAAC